MTEKDLVTVRTHALAYGGACIGEMICPGPRNGKKALVRGTIPGEELRGKIVKETKNLAHVALDHLLSTSPDRITPPCRYYGTCGGCDLQHIDIGVQRELKREMVETALTYQAKLVPDEGVTLLTVDLPSYHYRNRVSLHVDTDGRIGFYKARSGEVVDIDNCLLAAPLLNEGLGAVRRQGKSLAHYVGGITLEVVGSDVSLLIALREKTRKTKEFCQSSALDRLKDSFSQITVTQKGRVVSAAVPQNAEVVSARPHGRFFQINEEANSFLVSRVTTLVSTDEVTDLYSGFGNLSLPLAEQGNLVDAIEIDEALVSYGEFLAKERNLKGRISFYKESCEAYLKKHPLRSTVILDPPRSGAHAFAKSCFPEDAAEIIYVSCSLPSLSRDLQVLVTNGFQLRHVGVIDMFPQTHHVETISYLS